MILALMLTITPKDPSMLTFNSDCKLILPMIDLNSHMVVFSAQ